MRRLNKGLENGKQQRYASDQTLFLGMGLPITYTRFSLGDRLDFPWFDWEEDDKEEKDNEAERQLR